MLGSLMNWGCLWVTGMKPGWRKLRKKHTVNTDANALGCSYCLLENSVVRRRMERKLTHCMSLLYSFGDFLLFSSTKACKIIIEISDCMNLFFTQNAAIYWWCWQEMIYFHVAAHLWYVGHRFCLCEGRWTGRVAVEKTGVTKDKVLSRIEHLYSETRLIVFFLLW